MTAFFAQSLRPPGGNQVIGTTEDGKPVRRAIDGLTFDQQLWSWVVSGYVVIPCEVGGTPNAIELTPKFRPDIGANGYSHLLTFSFVAEEDPLGGIGVPAPQITIQVLNDKGPLDALPGYVGVTEAISTDVVAGTPYLAIFCDAIASLSLPDRMVLK